MKKLHSGKFVLSMGLLSLICTALYYAFRNKTYFDFLLWNLFLAWIPLLLAVVVAELGKRLAPGWVRSAVVTVLGAAWLLFFPNAPYIVTDLIHLTLQKAWYVEAGRWTFRYWYDFLMMLLISWNGFLLGFGSAYLVQYQVMKRFGGAVSWLFVIAVSMLGGYGILLGREYRLNSWDALTDAKALLSLIGESLNGQSVLFCLLFGVVILIVHGTFYYVMNGGWHAEDRDYPSTYRL